MIAEREGRLAVEAGYDNPPNLRDVLADKYGFKYYDDRRSFAFGWVPAEDVRDITTACREITP